MQECQGPKAAFAFAESGQPGGVQQAMLAAMQFYGSESKVVRVNMRACRQADSITKLIGSGALGLLKPASHLPHAK